MPELNRLLGMMVDVENMYTAMNREENGDTKKVYSHLFKLLRKCLLTLDTPIVEGPVGQPPFEKPSIYKAVNNLVIHKFSHLAQQEWKTMYELAKIFLHCLNTWDFPPPSSQKQVMSVEEATLYEIAYTRYDSVRRPHFCHVLLLQVVSFLPRARVLRFVEALRNHGRFRAHPLEGGV